VSAEVLLWGLPHIFFIETNLFMPNNKKLKVLFCTESGHINSGYGNYTRSLLSRLYDSNKYKIAELSCYRSCDIPKEEKWKIYPNAVTKTDERHESYQANFTNQFGQWRFDIVLADFKPDVVVDFRDIFMSIYQEASVFRNKFHWILAPTIDSLPLKQEWLSAMQHCDTLLTHTDWAKKELSQQYDLDIKGVVKDSVDTNIFKPKNQTSCRQQLSIELDTFVVGSVMRNAKRKLIPNTLKLISKLQKQNPNKKILLYLHTSYPEGKGWDIPELLLRYKVFNNVLFSYKCKSCSKWSPMLWHGEVCVCPYCKQKKLTICNVNNGLLDSDMHKIYNAMDIYLQYSICEGFGIPPLEAASCGTPFISVKHGAMLDLINDLDGFGVDIKCDFTEQESGADRVYPDDKHCLDILQNYIDMDLIQRRELKTKIRKNVIEKHSWDITANNFQNIFDSIPKSKIKWTPISKEYFDSLNKDMPDLASNRDFVYYVIDNVLEEPHLKKQFFIQQIIRSLNTGYIMNDSEVVKFGRQQAVNILQMWFNNKINLNKVLEDISILTNRDFLDYR